MKNIATIVFLLVLIAPFSSFPAFAGSADGRAQFVTSTHFVGDFKKGRRGKEFGRKFGKGFRKRGFRKGFHFHKRRHHFRRGDLTPYLYYRYPRYFYRNFGGFRKFYPDQDRSFYPNQGGSDYRDYRDWFDLPRR